METHELSNISLLLQQNMLSPSFFFIFKSNLFYQYLRKMYWTYLHLGIKGTYLPLFDVSNETLLSTWDDIDKITYSPHLFKIRSNPLSRSTYYVESN